MGKRKTKAKPIAKKKAKLSKNFDCLFCDHKQSVVIAIKSSLGTATISCNICKVGSEFPTTNLTKPVDIYYEWVDKVHEAHTLPPAEDDGDGPRSTSYDYENEDVSEGESVNSDDDYGYPAKRMKSEHSSSSSKYEHNSKYDDDDDDY